MQTGKRMAQLMEANTPKAGRIKTGLKPFAQEFYDHPAAGCGNTYSSLPALCATHAPSFLLSHPQTRLTGVGWNVPKHNGFEPGARWRVFSSHYL
jgi:hypothetical protein